MSEPEPVFSQRSRVTKDQPISYFMQQAVENPNLISLAAGLVDPASLPAAEVAEAIAEILAEPATAQAALQYGTTQGHAPLRQVLVERTCGLDHKKPSELALTADNVVVTTGSQQLLYLVGEVLLDPGDLVITEAPSYFVFQGTLSSLGARTLAVPMDEEGMRVDLLADLLARLESTGEITRLKMIYVVDYFQNPSGRTLSLERRQRLYELVESYSRKQRIFIVEDAAYRELRYDGEDLPSIKSFDVDNRHVILAMTFSKPCAPGLKTGYGLLPDDLVEPLLRFKGNHDFGSNNMTQHLLFRLVETGAYDRHIEQLCEVYREKRDTMLEAIEEYFTPLPDCYQPSWTQPHGGLYVWMTFPDAISTGPESPLMHAALEEGVLYVPGRFCYLPGSVPEPLPDYEARLSFGVAEPQALRTGIGRLARAYHRCLEGTLKRKPLACG